ncbi:hypothetical protein D3C81_2207540 [compost metagenome]
MVAVPVFAGNGFAEQWSQRADLATVIVLPIEAVVLAGGAEDFLRVFERAITVTID